MKEHSFSTEFASKYGIEEAIIFGNIYYWCLQNKENGINLKKGDDGVARYYTYNSIASIQENYYYMTLSKVYRVMEKLEAEGLIVTGCFNKRVNDRTRWYAVTEKGEEIYLECEGKIRDRRIVMKYETETIPKFSNSDVELMNRTARDFETLAKDYPSFFSTLFFNELNRKIVIKFSRGKLTKIALEKLDTDKE